MAQRKKTSRREFLSGKSATKAIGDLAPDEAATPAHSTSPDDATYRMQIGRTAMACEFEFFLNAGQHANGAEAALEALDLVDDLEDQMTVYRDHGEVSQINRLAAFRAVDVEPRLFGLLQQAMELNEWSEGAFDITAGPLSRLWGFHRREGRSPPDEAIEATRQQVGSRWVDLKPESTTIRFQKIGIEINLGGIGKGYALDRCGELMEERGVDSYLVHAGQSSVLARGSRKSAMEAERDGWRIAVRHPLKHDRRLAEILLRNQALGTSGSGKQFFYHQGHRYGHVLDPRTGRSAEGVLSATVVAPTAAVADALATAFFVLGVEKSQALCDKHPEVAALLVRPGRRAGALTLHAINLAEDAWRRWDQEP
ncbi:MAG: FAD:protein FMN transferase [Pirellulaceae bacterium]